MQYSAAVVLQARMRGYLARHLGNPTSDSVGNKSLIATNTVLDTYKKQSLSEQVVYGSDTQTQKRVVDENAASEPIVTGATDSQDRQIEASAVLLRTLETATDDVDRKNAIVPSMALDADMKPPSPLLSEQEEQEFAIGIQTLTAGADADSEMILTGNASDGETGQREMSAVPTTLTNNKVTVSTASNEEAEPLSPSSSVQEEESGVDIKTAGVDVASEPIATDNEGPATHIQAQVRGWFARQQSKREQRVEFAGVVGKQIDLDSPSASFYLSVGETLGGIRVDENDCILTVSDKNQFPTTMSFDEVEDAEDETQVGGVKN